MVFTVMLMVFAFVLMVFVIIINIRLVVFLAVAAAASVLAATAAAAVHIPAAGRAVLFFVYDALCDMSSVSSQPGIIEWTVIMYRVY